MLAKGDAMHEGHPIIRDKDKKVGYQSDKFILVFNTT